MQKFEVDFSYEVKEWGSCQIDADNVEQAEEFALEYIKETYDDIEDVSIEGIRPLI